MVAFVRNLRRLRSTASSATTTLSAIERLSRFHTQTNLRAFAHLLPLASARRARNEPNPALSPFTHHTLARAGETASGAVQFPACGGRRIIHKRSSPSVRARNLHGP